MCWEELQTGGVCRQHLVNVRAAGAPFRGIFPVTKRSVALGAASAPTARGIFGPQRFFTSVSPADLKWRRCCA